LIGVKGEGGDLTVSSCKWKKVKFKSFSLSEWKCETCGETGFSRHEKPPVNCLRRVFGLNIKGYGNTRNSRLKKITTIRVGGYNLSSLLVFSIIALLVAISHFKCSVYMLLGVESSVCISVALVDEIYNDDAAEGLRQTDASNDICSGFDYVIYSDVEKYLGMLRREIELLEHAIHGSPQEYQQEYRAYQLMWKIHRDFFDDKIDKCFGGDDGSKLSLEVSRMHNFIAEKADTLYDLIQN
jgi:hypothetical protein